MDREEAIKQIKKVMPHQWKETKEALAALIPELRESEDERTRKEIIHYLLHMAGGLSSAEQNRWIAYLEKQKEQKPKNILTDDDSLQTAYLKGQTDVLEDPEAYGLQQEQKPAEWSEEDEKMINHLVEALPQWANGQIAILPSQAEEYAKRLKSLRPFWKPSEEQMDALKELIDDANRAGWVTPGATELYEQLKKL